MIGDAEFSGIFFFAGTDTDTPPFSVERVDGRITTVTYNGNTEVGKA